MFDHDPSTQRFERPPSGVELWARREAKSDAMAADLLTRTRQPAKPRSKRRAWFTALLVLAVASVIVVYWLR